MRRADGTLFWVGAITAVKTRRYKIYRAYGSIAVMLSKQIKWVDLSIKITLFH
jgi:hypothetical protein